MQARAWSFLTPERSSVRDDRYFEDFDAIVISR